MSLRFLALLLALASPCSAQMRGRAGASQGPGSPVLRVAPLLSGSPAAAVPPLPAAAAGLTAPGPSAAEAAGAASPAEAAAPLIQAAEAIAEARAAEAPGGAAEAGALAALADGAPSAGVPPTVAAVEPAEREPRLAPAAGPQSGSRLPVPPPGPERPGLRQQVKNGASIALGLVLFVGGILVWIVLPLATFIIAAGLALLAPHFAWARRLYEPLKAQVARSSENARRYLPRWPR